MPSSFTWNIGAVFHVEQTSCECLFPTAARASIGLTLSHR
ncbi:hypothetical protein Rhow_003658 [Rhodococcus wratislaviensis]|uniref:Uncharacterized protein n=1 Tax=Rhodococcus wratislaviensis TaxID=44752 RepID=A0A402C8S0_RHOWR|nr:hypothetical protein Rhow_003658 [Rhodococcus wratislaviensis]